MTDTVVWRCGTCNEPVPPTWSPASDGSIYFCSRECFLEALRKYDEDTET